MAAARNDLHELIDRLPEAEVAAARRFLEFLSQEPIGPEFGASIRRGIEQAEASHTTVCESFDDMVDKLLGKD